MPLTREDSLRLLFLRLSVSRTRRLQERRRSRMETTRPERRDTFLTRGCPSAAFDTSSLKRSWFALGDRTGAKKKDPL